MTRNINQIFKEAITEHQKGKFKEAERLYRILLQADPSHLDANNNLGVSLMHQGKIGEAEKSFKKTIKLKADFAEGYNNLGNAQFQLGSLDEAYSSCKKAILLKSDFAEAYNILGEILYKQNKYLEAEENFNKVIILKPNIAETYNTLGNIFYKQNKYLEAEENFNKAIMLKPSFAEAYVNLGNILNILHFYDRAEENFKKAIALKPHLSNAHNNLGNTLLNVGKVVEAEKSLKKAIELNPEDPNAYCNLAISQYFLKKITSSLENYTRAYNLNPEMDFLLGVLLHMNMQLCIWDNFEKLLEVLSKKIIEGKKVSPPFYLLSLVDDPGIHMKSSKIYIKEKFQKSKILPNILKYSGHKKIRIGYFSADFNNHPVARLNAEVYELHNRKKFEIHAFSFGLDTNDEFNIRIKKGVDHFHEVQKMSDKDLVNYSRSLEIDIAVDLGGFTANNRQNIFSMSAAPIQISFLGYPATLGSNYIDYLVADSVLIPREKQNYYSEKIIYMPNSYQPNISIKGISKFSLSRQKEGLPKSAFVFCCFNNQYKITPTIFSVWMKILKATDNSVLWLFVKDLNAAENLKKEAAKLGIKEDRLIFAKPISHSEHLKRIQLADLFLDTLPYNAHTTASDALKAGLPLLTCLGNSFASRVAASLLNSVDLFELVTTTLDEYEALAIKLATDPKKLGKIKQKLNYNLSKTTLFNSSLYTKHLEEAFSIVYKRYNDGLDPDHINV